MRPDLSGVKVGASLWFVRTWPRAGEDVVVQRFVVGETARSWVVANDPSWDPTMRGLAKVPKKGPWWMPGVALSSVPWPSEAQARAVVATSKRAREVARRVERLEDPDVLREVERALDAAEAVAAKEA